MELLLNQFIGYSVKGPDGYIGKIVDFYFDDRSWRVLYVVVDTDGWLDRKIIISPLALLQAHVASKTFPVKITRQQIQLSPEIDTTQLKPGTELTDVCEHFAWPDHAGIINQPFESGISLTQSSLSMSEVEVEHSSYLSNQYLPRFRRTEVITGSEVKGPGIVLGKVFDYVLEDTSWQIRYLVLEVEKSTSKKHLLMDCRHLNDVFWSTGIIELNL